LSLDRQRLFGGTCGVSLVAHRDGFRVNRRPCWNSGGLHRTRSGRPQPRGYLADHESGDVHLDNIHFDFRHDSVPDDRTVYDHGNVFDNRNDDGYRFLLNSILGRGSRCDARLSFLPLC
jgi:hypothetical protein